MSVGVIDLRCEDIREEPLGIDVPEPILSWRLEGERRRGLRQTAFQVQAASSEKLLRDESISGWDTGRTTSEAMQVRYAGPVLSAFQRVFWRVRVWDETGSVSPWSSISIWTMGALVPEDWEPAQWISADALLAYTPPEGKTNSPQETWETLLLRWSFMVRPDLARAVVIVSGLGHFEMTVNERCISELLTPSWTDYTCSVFYDMYDITEALSVGENVVSLLLGNGFYNVHGGRYTKFVGKFAPQQAICLLRLEYVNGSLETIGTDSQWKAAPGPITFSCVYGGEDWDARRVEDGWCRPGFNDSCWENAALASGPGGILRGISSASPPMRTHEVLTPIATTPVPDTLGSSLIYDLGQNASLMPRLCVVGQAGSIVRVIPSELLATDGSLDRRSVGGREAYWQYTLKGDKGGEEWFSRFFYHGCRYLQVDCLPSPDGELPEVQELTARVVHSDCLPVGEFSCSHDLLNRIHNLVRWAQRSNLAHVITDCPHRERLGWLEQYHLHGPSLRYNFDLSRLYRKCFEDMVGAQTPEGLVPDIAPEYVVFKDGFRDSPEWGSAFILCAWQQYEWTGDISVLSRQYDAMKRYVEYLSGTATDSIVSHGLGDWYDIGPNPPGYAQLTPTALTATAHFYMDVQILARTASLLGHADAADLYAFQAETIRNAFNAAFLSPGSTHGYATGSQCANALPLTCGLVPEEERERIIAALVRDVEKHGMVITTGDVGHRYLLRALADSGHSDVIFAIHGTPSEKPGYALQLARGCTSLAESWDADPRWSQNHFMLGHITEWLYADLAGISLDPNRLGWSGVCLRPQPVEGVDWVRARFDSPRGAIAVEWRTSKDIFEMEVSLPPGVPARLELPALDVETTKEGNHSVLGRTDLIPLESSQPGRIVLSLLSGGDWRFISRRSL